MKTAYRQAHLQLATAVECLAQLEGLLFTKLRFPFGGKPCPAQWCTISEPIYDLANELIHNASWSQSNLRPCHDEVLPEPDRSHSETPFEEALLLAFHIYINDLYSICVAIDDSTERCAAAVALALDVVGCPLGLLDTLPREALLSLKKLKGEGKHEDIKVVMGWELNSITLTIGLTQGKFEIWKT
jgi:hypothetical protein